MQHATAAGAQIRTETMVTGWAGQRTLETTSPRGRELIEADAVILATGARERPRSARLIPGDRPSGVYTTGHLQNVVHIAHRGVGSRAVIVGAELVSYSAVLTLRHAGCRPVLMTTEHHRPESYAAFTTAARAGLGVTVATRTRVVRIIGDAGLAGGGDREPRHRRPAHHRLRHPRPDRRLGARPRAGPVGGPGHGSAQPRTRWSTWPCAPAGPGCSRSATWSIRSTPPTSPLSTGATSSPTCWPTCTAGPRPAGGVRLLAESPLRWISPGILPADVTAPPRGRLLAWTDTLVRFPTVTVRQDGVVLARRRLPWAASPGRIFRIPAGVLSAADPAGGTITVSLR